MESNPVMRHMQIAQMARENMDRMQEVIASGPHHYAQRPGFVWNPLRSWPRNAPCWCGNGQKAKRCHLQTTPDLVKAEEAADLQARLALALAANTSPNR